VDVRRDRVDRAVVGLEAVDEVGREDVGEAELVVQRRDVLDLRGVDVVLELRAGVRLERVRRVLRLEAGLEEVLRGRAGAAGDRAVDELHVGVLLVEHADQRVKTRLLGTRGPPGEDLDLVAAPRSASVAGAPVTGTTAAARGECETHEGGRRHRRARPAIDSHRDFPTPSSVVGDRRDDHVAPAGRTGAPSNPLPIQRLDPA